MNKFRRAKDLPKSDKKVPVSCRVREPLKAALLREAKGAGLTLSELVEAVLEDYGAFIAKK